MIDPLEATATPLDSMQFGIAPKKETNSLWIMALRDAEEWPEVYRRSSD